VNARSILACAAAAALLAAPLSRADSPIVAAPAQPAGHWHESSLADYRAHLQALTTIVQACARSRDMKTCDPTLVGPDDHVPLPQTGANPDHRLIRYGWLRVLLSKAQDKDRPSTDAAAPTDKSVVIPKDANNDPVLPTPPTTTQLLNDAETRLANDLAQTDAAPAPQPNYTQQRNAMQQVLAGRDFRNLEETTPRDSILEGLNNWLNNLFDSAARFSTRAAWIGFLIKWGFIIAVCVALVLGLIRLERRWRIRLVPDTDRPAPGAASARDWQLWLEDARKAAAAGLWREAIHFVYWASISRLESRRLWPADRARTPREYLTLVAPEDPRKPGLATLTGSFERTWYGGRAAAESDYRAAEQLANALISGSAVSNSSGGASA
jgi:hypothetical protein